jgi:hypothetical protein
MIFQNWIKWGFPVFDAQSAPYRYHSLLPSHGKDGVVGVGPPRCGVDEDMHVVVDDWRGNGLLEHDLNVLGLKDLLQRVEGKTRQLGLDKVGPVLHDGLKLDVPVCRLPPEQVNTMAPPSRYVKKARTNKHKKKKSPRDQVQHVNAVCGAALGFTSCTGKLDAEEGEQRLPRQPVSHLHQPGVEVDLAGEGGDGQKGGCPHDEEGGYCFLQRQRSGSTSSDDEPLQGWASAYVKEPWVDVGCLLEDDHVAPRALGCGDLQTKKD